MIQFNINLKPSGDPYKWKKGELDCDVGDQHFTALWLVVWSRIDLGASETNVPDKSKPEEPDLRRSG